MLVDIAVEVLECDAVVEAAIALAAASGVDGPGGFRQRSLAAFAAAIATASIGSCDAVGLVTGVEEILKPVATSGEAAPSPSATVALDCRVFDDVGGVA